MVFIRREFYMLNTSMSDLNGIAIHCADEPARIVTALGLIIKAF